MKNASLFSKMSAAVVTVAVIVIIIYSMLLGETAVRSITSLNILIFFSTVIFLSLLFSFFILKFQIRKHINDINSSLEALIEKNFDNKLKKDYPKEFTRLVDNINTVAETLSKFNKELSKSKVYLEGVVESTSDIIITVNKDGKILTFNSGAEKTLGYKRSEIIGKSINLLWADPSERDKAIQRLKYGDNVVNIETQFLTKKGEIREVLLTFSLLRNSKGEMIGTFGISKDITEEKRLSTKLLQTERFVAVGEVFTGVQHSLKNMLNAIKGGSYMVRIGLEKDDKNIFKEGWEIVEEGVNKMSKMSIDMLKFVKGWVPRFENVDLKYALSEMNLVIQSSAKKRGIDFNMEVSEGLPLINCDAQMIHTVIMDIVSNAMDACEMKEYDQEENPRVSLRAYQTNGDYNTIIEIKDNGCGMSESVKSNIFTPFFSKKLNKGTGLGLAIASRMVNAHHGRIDVVSEPNRGTLFQVVLPIDNTQKK